MTLDYKVGCDAEGRLVAVRARIVGDTGAYASVGAKVLERAAGHACGAYRVPNVDVEARTVYTNNPPAGAFRGFGVPQATFAIDGCLDRLAERVGIDGWEIRWRNALRTGDRFGTGQLLGPGVGLEKTLLAVRDAYRGARVAGIACGAKNVGIGNGMVERGRAILRVEPDASVTLWHSWTEMGQGVHTVFAQVVAEELGVDPARVRVLVDTERELDTGETTASRATTLGGQAVAEAARRARAALDALPPGRRPRDLAGREFAGEFVVDWTTPLGEGIEDPVTHLAYGWATQVVILDDEGRVARVVAAHDVGRAMNPTLLEGQVEGGVHMGLGLALTRGVRDRGRRAGRPTRSSRRGSSRRRGCRRSRSSSSRSPSRRARTARRAPARRSSSRRRPRWPARSTPSTGAGGRRCRCATRRRPGPPCRGWTRCRAPATPKGAAAPAGGRSPMSGRHPGPRLRPPPPVLGARPGDAGAAEDPDELRRRSSSRSGGASTRPSTSR